MEINYSHLFRKYKVFFLLFVLTAAIASAIFVYKQPIYYEAAAKVYVKDGSNLRIAYAAIKSNRLYDAVIGRLNLIEIFKVASADEARKILSRNLRTVLDSRLNTIDINFKSEDKILAAAVANAFAEGLGKTYPEIRLPETLGDPLDFRIVDSATVPALPAEQNKLGIVLLSILLSVVAAIFIAFLREQFFSHGLKAKQ